MTGSSENPKGAASRKGEIPVTLTAYIQVDLPEDFQVSGNVADLLGGDDPDGSVIAHAFEQLAESQELIDLLAIFHAAAQRHHADYPSTRVTYSPFQLPEQEL